MEDIVSRLLNYFDANNNNSKDNDNKKKLNNDYRLEIVWRNVLLMIILHITSVIGFFTTTIAAHPYTFLFNYVYLILTGLGVTAGAHRLWAHRSYEATTTLRIILMLFNSGALQNNIREWCRDHRVHHKYSETDADPHNSRRGFFFAHIGWLMCRKHPDVKAKGKSVILDDLDNDPVIRFQYKYYKPLAVFMTFILPSYIPVVCWNESPIYSYLCSSTRYCLLLHGTWLVNSAAHLWGQRPYDNRIQPVESKLVQYVAFGEGYHNYHHVFPYDYSTSELSWFNNINFTTLIIDLLASIGMVKNRKKVDTNLIMKRVKNTGNIELNQQYKIEHPKLVIRQIFHTIFAMTTPLMAFTVARICLSIFMCFYNLK